MRIFKIKRFARWAKKEDVGDAVLRKAVQEIEEGLVDAILGGSIYKKRIPVGSRGKSSGARTILAYRSNDRSFFVYGFMKSSRSNIDESNLQALKDFASELLNLEDEVINNLLEIGELEEITHG